MFSPIDSKPEGVRLFKEGHFGNSLRQWDTLEDLDLDPYDGPIVIRSKAAHGGGPCTYNIPKLMVPRILCRPPWDQIPLKDVYFNELLPPEFSTLQAEIMEDVTGEWYMRYSLERVYFREALQRPLVAAGLKALEIVRHFADWKLFQCVRELFECYPDHVVELTTTDRSFGTRRWNGIVWEVRSY